MIDLNKLIAESGMAIQTSKALKKQLYNKAAQRYAHAGLPVSSDTKQQLIDFGRFGNDEMSQMERDAYQAGQEGLQFGKDYADKLEREQAEAEKEKKTYPINEIVGGAAVLSSLIPDQQPDDNTDYIQAGYNPYAKGTGSKALYHTGGMMKDEGVPEGWHMMPDGMLMRNDEMMAKMRNKGMMGDEMMGEEMMYRSGGSLSSAKAKEILRDGNVNGKPITAKQKRYFGFIAGGGNPDMAAGGGLERDEDYGSKSKPYPSVDSSDFAGGGRSYPIPTRADAVDALRLAGLHGRSDVRAKVFRKYPDLKKADGGKVNESVVDYISSVGGDSSFKNREAIFTKQFGGKYKGTAKQNLQLLSLLQGEGDFLDTKAPTPAAKPSLRKAPAIKSDEALLQSGVVVDKRLGKGYIVKDGEIVRTMDVLTGQNVEGNKNTVTDIPSARFEQKTTPTGYYEMQGVGRNIGHSSLKKYEGNIQSIYGIEANNVPSPEVGANLAIHQTAQPEKRDKLYGTDKPYASWGCINCKKPDIAAINEMFPQGDTIRVIDSKREKDKAYLSQYRNRAAQKEVPYPMRTKASSPFDNTYEDGGVVPIYAEGGDVESTSPPKLRTVGPNVETAAQRFVTQQEKYVKSPIYKQRLQKSGVANPDKVIKDRLANLGRTEFFEAETPFTTYFKTEKGDTPRIQLAPDSTSAVAAHEVSHITNLPTFGAKAINEATGQSMSMGESWKFINRNRNITPEMRKQMYENYSSNVRQFGQYSDPTRKFNVPGDKPGEVRYFDPHDIGTSETKSDLDAFRHMLFENKITPSYGADITPEMMQKARANKAITGDKNFQRFSKAFTDEDIITLNNEIAMQQAQAKPSLMAKAGKKLKKKSYGK